MAITINVGQQQSTGINVGDVAYIKGDDGFSPIIETEEITGGHRVTITDAEGTKQVDVMDGAPGRDGVDGQDGAPGRDGVDGAPGRDGVDGAPGESAYQAAVEAGFTGTEAEFNEYLSGIGDLTEDVAQQKSAIEDLQALTNRKAGMLVDSASGAIASFVPDSTIDNLLGVSVAIEPVQAGSGDPSPDNVRHISGWDAVEVQRTGVNLADDEQFSIEKPSFTTDTYWLGLTENADGTFTLTRPIGWGGYGKVFLGTFGAGTYTVSFETVDTAGVTCKAALAVKKTGTWENSATVGAVDAPIGRTAFSPFTVSEPSDIWISVGPFNNNGAQVVSGNYQVESGSTATAYHPFAGNRYTIPLGDTIYGGTLTIAEDGSVNALVDRVMPSLADATLYRDNGTHKIWAKAVDYLSPNAAGGNAISNITNSFGIVSSTALVTKIQFPRGTQYSLFASIPADFDIADVQACYELADPIVIDLDPVTISAIAGQTNNVWSDAGDVRVVFAADLKNYIDSKIAAAVAALS